jgi:hypothetical protein
LVPTEHKFGYVMGGVIWGAGVIKQESVGIVPQYAVFKLIVILTVQGKNRSNCLTIIRVVCDKCVIRVVPVHVEGVHLYFTNLRM